jgi:hypothetical protein
MDRPVKCSDIPDGRVVELARRWREWNRDHHGEMVRWLHGGKPPPNRPPGVVQALMDEFDIPYKLALTKVLRLCDRKNGRPPLLEYGTSPNYAWPR